MSTTTATDTTPSKAHVIRTLAKSLREYRTASLLSPLFVIVEAVIEIAIPTVIAILIDKGISGKSMPDIWKYGGILIACAVVSLCAGFLSGRFAAIGSSGFAKNLRHDEFEKVQQFSFANIDRFSTGSIITRLTTDVTNVQNAYQMLIRVGMRAPIMLIVAWIFAFRISPQISMVFLACIPVLAVGLFGLIIVVHPIFERVFHTYDELNNVVDENLQGVRVVKSFNREDFEGKKFGRISLKIYEQFCKAEKLLSINSPLFNLCMYASLIAIAWVGARQIVASGNNAALGLTTGDLTALVTYAMQIMMAMMMLSMIFVMVIISRASAERICGVLTEESTIREADEPITTVADGSIDFDHVSFRYSEHSERPVLDDIDLHIRSGQTIGIVGGTGSAKTSLVQLIPRLYDVSSGALKVGGVDVRDYELEALRDEVAMVLQKNVLFAGTIAENLRWGNPYATDEEIRHACELAQADGFIQEFPDKYNTYIEQGRHECLRRPAAAPVHRARTAQEAEDPDPRRFDVSGGHQDGQAHPRSVPPRDPEHHEDHHRAARRVRRGIRQDRRHARRPHPRPGHERGIARALRGIPQHLRIADAAAQPTGPRQGIAGPARGRGRGERFRDRLQRRHAHKRRHRAAEGARTRAASAYGARHRSNQGR